MINAKLAVGVGYEFVVTSAHDVKGINVKYTGKLVSVNDDVYPLYKGATFKDSLKIDEIMDGPENLQIHKINEHLVA